MFRLKKDDSKLPPNGTKAALTLFLIVLVYVVLSMLNVPDLNTVDQINRFFYISWASVLIIKATFIFYLIRDEAYMSLRSSLVLISQLLVALGCLYLYFNARMGTGIFASI